MLYHRAALFQLKPVKVLLNIQIIHLHNTNLKKCVHNIFDMIKDTMALTNN